MRGTAAPWSRTIPSCLVLLVLLPAASAAVLHGTIYTTELEVATNVLVEIDTTPHQRMLSTDGAYRFTVGPGAYVIVATFTEDGRNATSTEQVVVDQDGEFVFDLFLVPDIDDLIDDDLPPETVLDDIGGEEGIGAMGVAARVAIVLAVLALLFVIWRLLRRPAAAPGGEADDGTAAAVLRIIGERGGRMTQKELRRELPDSEAKISLVVSDLEAQGLLKKIRKGRGNILVLHKKI